jgi:diguanylate cyclase (GGDEF)-like protein/PAS domain S-box-containing protein
VTGRGGPPVDVPVGLEAVAPSPADLFEHAPCGYLCTTSDGLVLAVNQTFLRWTGHARADVLAQGFTDLLTIGSRMLFEMRCLPVLRLKGELREVALEVRHAEGRPLPTLVNAVLRTDPDTGASQVWIAVFDSTERKDYERDLLVARRSAEESEARLRVLQSASETFGAASTEPALLAALAELARTTLDAAATRVLLADDTAEALVPVGDGGYPLGEPVRLDAFRPEVECHRLGTMVTVADLAEAERTFPVVAGPMSAEHVEAFVVTALAVPDSPGGVLVCLFRRRRVFSASEQDLLLALVRLAGQALQRIRLQAQLHHAALHDPLTGLANREFVGERLAQVLACARRTQREMALVFFDLDGFKPVNDILGHLVGDAVLVQVGQRLKERLRGGDTVGRFGGDEFLVVCGDDPGSEPADYQRLAERLRAAVQLPMDGVPPELSPTVSVGVARHRPRPGLQKDPEDLMRAADAAMYESKARGKNMVTVLDV